MLNYNHLHYFHVAAMEGSVAAAAHKLGVTQPTVSEQLRRLEQTLGTTLFERTPSGLKLTEAGRLAFEHTSAMFRASERLVESLGHSRGRVPRTLRVGISTSTARSTTSDFLLPLLALDECVPTIRTTDTAELLRDIRGGDLDLVLCEHEPPETNRPGLHSALIAHTTLVAIAPPDVDPGPDWQDVALVQYRAASPFRWDVEAFLDARGYRPTVAAEADDASFLVEVAMRGGYLVVVPRAVAREAIAARHVRVLASFEPAHVGIYAVYPDGSLAELARRAVEALIEHARRTGDVEAVTGE